MRYGPGGVVRSRRRGTVAGMNAKNTTNPFRFGMQVDAPLPGLDWLDSARKVEDSGFSSLLMPDHFEGQFGPIAALSAAAAVTTTLKIGALVFGNDYRHPVILAKEMATIDQISGGRLELGLGAGWMRTDYDKAGMNYDRPGLRIDRMIESLEVIRKCWGPDQFDYQGEHYQLAGYDGMPKPVADGGPPIIIGGGGPRMLGVAATYADVVGVTANLRAGEIGPEAIADSAPDAYDTKVARVREVAGDRHIELSSLTMATIVTDDREGQIEGLAAMFGMPAEVLSKSPAVLVGDVDDICDALVERRERWGFSYVVVQADAGDGFNEVVARLAGS